MFDPAKSLSLSHLIFLFPLLPSLPSTILQLVKPNLRNIDTWGFHGGSMVKTLPDNAGYLGSISGPGEQLRPCAKLLSLCSRAWKQQLLSPYTTATEARMPWSLCPSHRSEKPMLCKRRVVPTLRS